MDGDAVARGPGACRSRTPVELAVPAGHVGEHVLRAALAASMAIGRTVRLAGVRETERASGIARRDLALIEAARRVAKARVSGAAIGTCAFEFRPTTIMAGEHRVALGNGASVTGVVTMLAPVLARADAPSVLSVSGATHVPGTPTGDALEACWCPLVSRTGSHLALTTLRHGFAPVGGGEVRLAVTPGPAAALHLHPDTSAPGRRAICTLAGIADDVARRELESLVASIALADEACEVRRVESECPGNVLALEIRFATHVEWLEVHGREGLPAAQVAKALVTLWRRRARRGDVLDSALVAGLLPSLALGAGGTLRMRRPGEIVEAVANVLHAFGLGPVEWLRDDAEADVPDGVDRVGTLHVGGRAG